MALPAVAACPGWWECACPSMWEGSGVSRAAITERRSGLGSLSAAAATLRTEQVPGADRANGSVVSCGRRLGRGGSGLAFG